MHTVEELRRERQRGCIGDGVLGARVPRAGDFDLRRRKVDGVKFDAGVGALNVFSHGANASGQVEHASSGRGVKGGQHPRGAELRLLDESRDFGGVRGTVNVGGRLRHELGSRPHALNLRDATILRLA